MFEGQLLIQNWNGFYHPSCDCEQASPRAKGKLQMSIVILNKIMRKIVEKIEPIRAGYNTTGNFFWLFIFMVLLIMIIGNKKETKGSKKC